MTIAAGSRLGRYQIVELLGAGGMGMVYRAHDEQLQRDVAIKVLPPGVVVDEDASRRFRKEALALAKLNHPNIATIYDVGEESGTAYLVMECVAGESLASRLSRGPLSLPDALSISGQIADGLAAAHEHDVIHRDLKPANVMITPRGQVKVLDFGLAKLLAPTDASSATQSRAEMGGAGTPLYMSPEQAFGDQLDPRTDLWSLGVVMFESLAGRTPFQGATQWALLNAVSHDTPPLLRALRPELPPGVDAIVTRALSKDPAARYPSAVAMGAAIGAELQTISHPPATVPSGVRLRWWMPLTVAAVLAAIITAGVFIVTGIKHRNWARSDAPAAVERMIAANVPLAAYRVLSHARSYLPNDTTLARLLGDHARGIAIQSSPSGARVEINDYLTPDSAWQDLGITPIRQVTVPKGYLRWRVTPPHGAPMLLAPFTEQSMNFALDSAAAAAPGMVRVGAGEFGGYISFIGFVGPYAMPTFDIDRDEVTNQEYQQFVDSGGYRNHSYWQEPFVDQGHPVTWDSAMARFRDRTGRAGPSTWSGGHYPAGQANYPVAGVSWYEAAAYAAFRSKSLPTFAQWHEAAPNETGRYVTALSNMGGTAVAPVGAFRGVGPYGTFDMAGNVREWVYNANDAGNRFILGGAWSSPTYLYGSSEALPPFDRSPTNGMRDVRNLSPLVPALTQPIHTMTRDFTRFTPASDAVFQAYRAMFAYDSTPLHATIDGVVQRTADFTEQKVSFDAAYNGERVPGYLYLPTRVKPPYQTVLFFPSARVLGLTNSRTLGDTAFFDYVVQSGRAVFYPIYQDTYERRARGSEPGPTEPMDVLIDRAKDVGRALDYLQSRPDIDHDRLAYMGVSMGAAEGAIYATLQQHRLRTVVLLDGGYFLGPAHPGSDQADFVPRLKVPVLMVNGRYDQTFTLREASLPMFQMLGTPASDKKQVLLEASHDVTAQRPILVAAVLTWLDKYLGRVQ